MYKIQEKTKTNAENNLVGTNILLSAQWHNDSVEQQGDVMSANGETSCVKPKKLL